MIVCALCLKDEGDSPIPAAAANVQFIEIFSADGIEFKISYIIKKHLGILYDAKDDHKTIICLTCWGLLWNFHQYYNRILKVHKLLETETTHVVRKDDEYDVVDNMDPLPGVGNRGNSPLIKCEKIAKQQKFMVVNEDFFDAGKVEVQDLELLPQIEIIEDSINMKSIESVSNKNTMKLIDDDDDDNDDDDDDDDHGGDFNYDNNDDNSNDKTDLQTAIVNKNESDEIQIRHSRPRKCKNVNTTFESDDNDVENIKKLNKIINAKRAYNIRNCGGVKPVLSDDEDDLDYSIEDERYAKLDPPRIPHRPVRYNKRDLPRKIVKHMTREEIEERKKLQDEYESVIKRFFKKFVCPICELWVHNFQEMRQHFRTSHVDVKSYMTCCGRKFFQRKTLAEHIYVHWDPDHFKCKTCDRILLDGRALDLHEQSHASGSAEDVSIKIKKLFHCDKCPRTFTTKTAVEYHIFSKHVPPSEFQYNCNECNKKLPTERKLREHMKCVHDPERAIICDKCGKVMRSQANLKKHHEVEHSKVPRPKPVPAQCEICGSWLRDMTGLKQHIRASHENIGVEHRCHICNKTSTNARALRRHVYHNHECERKFKCKMCEKAFKRPQDLREHTSTHTGEVLYTCPNCPMTFFSKANMYKHRQRLHRVEYEADRKKPRPPNIMQQSVVATEAMKQLIK